MMVGHLMLYHPAFVALRQFIDAGELGGLGEVLAGASQLRARIAGEELREALGSGREPDHDPQGRDVVERVRLRPPDAPHQAQAVAPRAQGRSLMAVGRSEPAAGVGEDKILPRDAGEQPC